MAGPLYAQRANYLGLGGVVGSPIGVTAKLWVDGYRAVDCGVGFSRELVVYGDYLWHRWHFQSQPAKGRIPVYVGVGAQVKAEDDPELGLRAVLGTAYWLQNSPVELFIELVPLARVSPDFSIGLNAAAGVRYYFQLE